jgi:hypothetical protein
MLQLFATGVVDTGDKFNAGVVIPVATATGIPTPAVLVANLKVWWQLPLFLFILSFFIHS